jgi:hypothetical protein
MSPLAWAGCMAVVLGISLPSTTFPVSVLKTRPSVCVLSISPPFSLLASMPHPRKYSEGSLISILSSRLGQPQMEALVTPRARSRDG